VSLVYEWFLGYWVGAAWMLRGLGDVLERDWNSGRSEDWW
jgi:hypothetical protein